MTLRGHQCLQVDDDYDCTPGSTPNGRTQTNTNKQTNFCVVFIGNSPQASGVVSVCQSVSEWCQYSTMISLTQAQGLRS